MKSEVEIIKDKYWKARQKEISLLMDSTTGMLKEEYKDWVSCPIANSPYKLLFHKDGFSFVQCKDCGLIFINPQVKESNLLDVYRESESFDIWIELLTSREGMEFDFKKYSKVLDELEKYKGDRNILDIGCSTGHFLSLAVKRGWKGVGLELNKKAYDIASKSKATILNNTLGETKFPDKSFDVITLWGVIEHLKNPIDVLKNTKKVLKDDGVLFIFCPNVDYNNYDIESRTFDGRNHLWYFNKYTLKRLLSKVAFDSIKAIVDYNGRKLISYFKKKIVNRKIIC